MGFEEIARALVCQCRAFFIVMSAFRAGEGMIIFGVVMQGHLRMVIETGMHGGLGLWRDELVLAGNVQHERVGDIGGFVEPVRDRHTIITD